MIENRKGHIFRGQPIFRFFSFFGVRFSGSASISGLKPEIHASGPRKFGRYENLKRAESPSVQSPDLAGLGSNRFNQRGLRSNRVWRTSQHFSILLIPLLDTEKMLEVRTESRWKRHRGAEQRGIDWRRCFLSCSARVQFSDSSAILPRSPIGCE